MGAIFLPSRQIAQPQSPVGLDRQNPLLRGMTPMMVVNGALLREVSANKPLIVGGTITPVTTVFGRALDTGLAADAGVTDGILNTNACVDFWYGQYLNNGVSGQYLYGDYNANGLGLAGAHSSIGYNCAWYDGTVLNDAGFALTSGTFYFFVVVREVDGGVHKVYMNGRLIITGANAGATGGNLCFGSLGRGFWTVSTLSAAQRMVLFGRLYGRGWSAKEVSQFTDNPRQIFKVPARRLYIVGSASATPNISSVSSATPREGASLTITGTNFGASQGSGDVKINGVAQTVTSWSDTSIVVSIVLGTNKFGAAYTVVVRDNALTPSNSYAGITGLLPVSGDDYVNVGTPNPDTTLRLTSIADAVSGDQVEWYTQGGLIVINSDLTFSAGPGVTSVRARIWTSGSGYGPWTTQQLSGLAATTMHRFRRLANR